jgi:hypothetical protein
MPKQWDNLGTDSKTAGGERLLRLSVGKPHKTEAKAFHFRGRFTGTQIRVVIPRPLQELANAMHSNIEMRSKGCLQLL